MDQFSSVIPFWKPQNVSFLLRRGGLGPPAPPPFDAPAAACVFVFAPVAHLVRTFLWSARLSLLTLFQ